MQLHTCVLVQSSLIAVPFSLFARICPAVSRAKRSRLLPCSLSSTLVLPQTHFSRIVLLIFELDALPYSWLSKMATTDTATATGADLQTDAPIRRSGGSHVSLNGFKAPQPLAPIRTHTKKKYRHVAAVHSKPRTSCLSHDSEASPSFLGFRNLMVIVLGMLTES